MQRTLNKLFSLVNIASLVFQLVAPLVTLAPLPAFATTTETKLSWDNSKNSFHFLVNSNQTVDYLLAYRTPDKTEAITGSGKDDGGNFSRDLYAGTCSSGVCLPHQVLRGILKTKIGGTVNAQLFTINNGNLDIAKSGTDKDLNLSDEETAWLENPTPENLGKVNLVAVDSLPAPPPATPSATVATPSAETPVSQPTPQASSSSQATVAGTQTESTEHGSLSATILKNTAAPSLDLSSPTSADSATVTTNKPDYSPTDTVVITGTNFLPKHDYTLEISSTDPPVVDFKTTITTKPDGTFVYAYQLDGNYRPNYTIYLKDSSTIIATTTFIDSDWPSCGFQCKANDVTVTSFNLVNQQGNPITSCTNGQTVTAYLAGTFYNNTNTDRPAVILLGDLYQGNTLLQHLQTIVGQNTVAGVCAANDLPGKTSTTDNSLTSFSWTCGQTVTVQNLVISWGTGNDTCTSFFNAPSCGERTTKCYSSSTFNVSGPGQLIVHKTFTDNHSNVGITINVTGTNSASGTTDSNGNATFEPGNGTYTAHATEPAGYYESANTCVSVTVTAGQTTNCTITDSPTNGTLVVHKTFTDQHSNSGITINITGTSSTSGPTNGSGDASFSLGAGTYTAHATEPAGYFESSNGCVNVSLTAGQTTNCTITDSKILGTITVHKTIVGGSATPGQFCFTLSPDPGNGQVCANENGDAVFSNVPAGSYTASETASAADYTQTNTTCNNAMVIVSNGDSKSCAITNTRNQGTIELKKAWSGTGGQTTLNIGATPSGTDVASTQTGTNGNTPLTTGTRTVNTGTYYVSETGGLDNYSSSLACTDNEQPVTPGGNNSLTVASGHAVICTFTNTRNTGTIKIVKNTSGGNGTFNFTVSGETGSTPSITTSGGTGSSGPMAVNTGTYTVSETVPAGWNLSSSSCTDGSTTFSATGFSVAAGKNIVCTFNDTKLGTMIVKKVMVGGTDTFTFTGNVAGTISTNNGTLTVNNVTPGTYSSVESAKSGWNLDSISCDDGQSTNASTGNTGTRTATFKVDAGETVTCTFTNTKKPTLAIYKYCDPRGDIGKFNLQIDGNNVTSDTVCGGWTNGAIEVSIGSHAVGETAGSGTNLANYTSVIGGDCAPNGTVSLAAGDAKTCTITNTRNTGSIKVNKLADTDGNGSFETLNPESFNWSLDGSGTNAMGSAVSGVNTGTHSVNENSVANYHLVGWYYNNNPDTSCANPASKQLPASLSVTTGQTTEITICNVRDTGTIKIVKNTSGADGTFNFTVSGGTGSTPSIATSGSTGSSGPTTVITGTYTVSETVPVGWTLSSSSCTDGSTTFSATGFSVVAGKNIVCTFNDTKHGAIIVKKVMVGGTDSFTFTGDVAGTISSNNGTLTASDVLPGTYSSTESPKTGWDLTDISCDDGRSQTPSVGDVKSAKATFNVDPGETVTCTFTNTKRGKVIVTKFLDDNANGTQDEGENGLSGWDMTLGDMTQTTTGEFGQTEFDNVTPGSHFLSETPQDEDGWTLSNIYCNNEDFTIDTSNDHEVFVPAGGTINCFVGNYQNSHIIVIKDVVKPDGSPVTDTSTLFDFHIREHSNKLDVVDPFQLTDGQSQSFDLTPGSYDVNEVLNQTNYNFAGCEAVYSGQSVGITIEGGKNVILGSNDTVTVTCTNKQKPGHFGGFKWNDQNGNGQFDCSFQGETRVCEPKLSRWTIYLDLNGNGQLDEGEPSTQTDKSGNYSFDVDPGTYRVCEVVQPGWKQNYPINENNNCHTVTVGSNETFDGQKNFGNQLQNPVLTITKANDAVGDKAPGDAVMFTLTVTATQSGVNNVTVTDLPAGGFHYRSGTGMVSKNGGPTTPATFAHAYASPGVWDLGNMNVGDVFTLTYIADIDGSEQAGLYTDLAWAQGKSLANADVLANAQNPGFVNENFVGTQVNIIKENQSTTTITGQVLGASTSLPATGGKTAWIILATLLLLSGMGLVYYGIKKNHA